MPTNKPTKLTASERSANALAQEPQTVAKYLRLLAGTSREKAAAKAGLSESRYAWIEDGVAQFTEPEEEAAFERVLGVDFELLSERPTEANRDAALRGLI